MGSLIFNTDYSLFLLNSCLILGATSYMHLAHRLWSPVQGLIFLVVNKNDESMYEEFIEYDHIFGEGLVAKANRIDQLEEMPDGIFSVKKKPQACFNCSFHKHCYGESHHENI